MDQKCKVILDYIEVETLTKRRVEATATSDVTYT